MYVQRSSFRTRLGHMPIDPRMRNACIPSPRSISQPAELHDTKSIYTALHSSAPSTHGHSDYAMHHPRFLLAAADDARIPLGRPAALS